MRFLGPGGASREVVEETYHDTLVIGLGAGVVADRMLRTVP